MTTMAIIYHHDKHLIDCGGSKKIEELRPEYSE